MMRCTVYAAALAALMFGFAVFGFADDGTLELNLGSGSKSRQMVLDTEGNEPVFAAWEIIPRESEPEDLLSPRQKKLIEMQIPLHIGDQAAIEPVDALSIDTPHKLDKASSNLRGWLSEAISRHTLLAIIGLVLLSKIGYWIGDRFRTRKKNARLKGWLR